MIYLWDKLVCKLIKGAWLMLMSEYQNQVKNQQSQVKKSKGGKNAKN